MKLSENVQQVFYTLLFPFNLKSGEELTNLLVDRKFGNLSLTIEQRGLKYVLKVEGFESEQEARDYANHLWAVFAWLLVNTDDGMPFDVNLEFGHTYYPPDPRVAAENLAWTFGETAEEGEVIDVFLDGDLPSVYRTDHKIRRLFGGNVDFTRTRNSENFVSTLENLSTTNISKIVKQPKLRTALELYNAHFYENSNNAKFLTLIIVLETLTISHEKNKVALDLIDEWKEKLNMEKTKYQENTDEYESLIALDRELFFKRDASLTSQIRTLVLDTLTKEENINASDYARKVGKLYGLRGTLVHEGSLPPDVLNSALEQAKIIVIAVLKAKLLEAIK